MECCTLQQPSHCHMVSPVETLGSACLNCCEVTESFWEKGMISINLRAEKIRHPFTCSETTWSCQTNFPGCIRHWVFCTAGVEGSRGTHSGDAERHTLPLCSLCMAALKSTQMEWNGIQTALNLTPFTKANVRGLALLWIEKSFCYRSQ